jgi:hypothetical protein
MNDLLTKKILEGIINAYRWPLRVCRYKSHG